MPKKIIRIKKNRPSFYSNPPNPKGGGIPWGTRGSTHQLTINPSSQGYPYFKNAGANTGLDEPSNYAQPISQVLNTNRLVYPSTKAQLKSYPKFANFYIDNFYQKGSDGSYNPVVGGMRGMLNIPSGGAGMPYGGGGGMPTGGTGMPYGGGRTIGGTPGEYPAYQPVKKEPVEAGSANRNVEEPEVKTEIPDAQPGMVNDHAAGVAPGHQQPHVHNDAIPPLENGNPDDDAFEDHEAIGDEVDQNETVNVNNPIGNEQVLADQERQRRLAAERAQQILSASAERSRQEQIRMVEEANARRREESARAEEIRLREESALAEEFRLREEAIAERRRKQEEQELEQDRRMQEMRTAQRLREESALAEEFRLSEERRQKQDEQEREQQIRMRQMRDEQASRESEQQSNESLRSKEQLVNTLLADNATPADVFGLNTETTLESLKEAWRQKRLTLNLPGDVANSGGATDKLESLYQAAQAIVVTRKIRIGTTAWDVLGVSQNASAAAVDAAYTKLTSILNLPGASGYRRSGPVMEALRLLDQAKNEMTPRTNRTRSQTRAQQQYYEDPFSRMGNNR
jgi:hypothetical protein